MVVLVGVGVRRGVGIRREGKLDELDGLNNWSDAGDGGLFREGYVNEGTDASEGSVLMGGVANGGNMVDGGKELNGGGL